MASDIAARKRELRRRFRAERDGLEPARRAALDRCIARAVRATAAWAQADAVFTYGSVGSEVATRPLAEGAWRAGKVVALPRCAPGRTLIWCRIEPGELDGLEPGTHGIPEPPACEGRRVDPTMFERPLALVPGLAFDRKGFRLGYGGGYYDRFLVSFPGRTLGLCRGAQLVPSLAELGAVDAFDRSVDAVATESGVRACSPEAS